MLYFLITNLLKAERSSSLLVCITKVPLLLAFPLHIWCCLQHVALWKLKTFFETAQTLVTQESMPF